jgi:hypothetical protein
VGTPVEEALAGEIPSMTSILSKRRKHGAMARAVRRDEKIVEEGKERGRAGRREEREGGEEG